MPGRRTGAAAGGGRRRALMTNSRASRSAMGPAVHWQSCSASWRWPRSVSTRPRGETRLPERDDPGSDPGARLDWVIVAAESPGLSTRTSARCLQL